MTKQEEMLAMIDTELGMPIVREIARWFVCGYSENWATQVAFRLAKIDADDAEREEESPNVLLSKFNR